MAKKTKNSEPEITAPKLYTTLEKEASAEFTEKKSVFIGHACPVKTEEEAIDFIKKIRGEYPDAKHNVYAYQLHGGGIARYSDDGEPQGTAGVPVLDVIKKSGADDCAVVVTRYFGGILLGAGGLVRAYANGAKIALDAAHIVTYENYIEFELACDYSAYQKIENELPKYGVITDDCSFGAEIVLRLAVKETRYGEFEARIAEMFAGKLAVKRNGERFDFK
ncbi:MAG: YigZ family protein [Clostridiales bacterium]|nr:YigZ family protein [Clostridiales bacterium]